MIKASKEVQQYLATAKPGDRAVYVNMDAIRELPEQYEVVVTKVDYDKNNLANDFSNVGSKSCPSWMPDPQLMYKIAEAKGISGTDKSESESIVEEVDINPMLCKPMDSLPNVRKMVVGKRVTKQSFVLQDDGTERTSSVCTIEYNVWERCMEAWSKEESYTEGYSKKGQYDNKYQTMYQRRAHFDSEMKFAQSKAETKANLKTIRELAGMMTGFAPDDLKAGFLIFSRVRRTTDSLKVEAAAKLAPPPQAVIPEPEPVQTKKQRLLSELNLVQEMGGVPESHKTRVGSCIAWLGTSPADDYSSWDKSLALYGELTRGQKDFPSVEELR